ncbi:hypothetical protein E3N88_35765 [Mikania micrantha]|uniref:Uncharacterized protein n=1 Tax=Mikania micrantha TaxID=192012 RepID=A0A5N6M1V9_9ASTR|nr:hypothetical protein E3N88_35765 [Mikania micrantha]
MDPSRYAIPLGERLRDTRSSSGDSESRISPRYAKNKFDRPSRLKTLELGEEARRIEATIHAPNHHHQELLLLNLIIKELLRCYRFTDFKVLEC